MPPSVFTDNELHLMIHVLDRIIPSAEGFPSAGEAGIVDYISRQAAQSFELKQSLSKGLADIESGGDVAFAKLSDVEKDSVLREIEIEEPDFFDQLLIQTYNGYYTRSDILKLLDMEDRPPQPLGHQMDSMDASLLDEVIKRGRVYRKV